MRGLTGVLCAVCVGVSARASEVNSANVPRTQLHVVSSARAGLIQAFDAQTKSIVAESPAAGVRFQSLPEGFAAIFNSPGGDAVEAWIGWPTGALLSVVAGRGRAENFEARWVLGARGRSFVILNERVNNKDLVRRVIGARVAPIRRRGFAIVGDAEAASQSGFAWTFDDVTRALAEGRDRAPADGRPDLDLMLEVSEEIPVMFAGQPFAMRARILPPAELAAGFASPPPPGQEYSRFGLPFDFEPSEGPLLELFETYQGQRGLFGRDHDGVWPYEDVPGQGLRRCGKAF